jgi:hypothetical protein
MRCIPHRRIDDFGMEGRVLVGDVGVERYARIIAVFEIHLPNGFAASSGAVGLQ